ncbi:Spy/CpxP family protein refolding chaperone [Marinobacterium sediminicola]|uniref:Signaling pathway modulator ZraP n=1 Tax=Marinobacterium sediminicola TaxID=518898 RepID=A0ABY1S114_9GAMM|nr:periplasmic heavy metal sensor [Marinobacterium sediminicola]ULG69824.1 periplasmic heavy metal sensor [Marinobacterium sediminicola]SMR75362.1 Heavy-metal resistance [Marinobacterium sediminicola]
MFRIEITRPLLPALLGLALAIPVSAHNHMMQQAPTNMPGPAMAQGMGPGMMYGYGPMMGYGMGGHMMGYGMGMGGMGMGGMGMGSMGIMPCPMMGGIQGGPNTFGLQLDENQQQRMNEIGKKVWQLYQEQMKEMWEHHNEMQQLWQDGKPDNDKLLNAHREMQQEQLEMLEQRLKLQQEMESVLTEEQRQQLWQMHRGMYRGGQ